MKRKLLFLLTIGLFLLGGCGNRSEKDIINDLTKKINASKSYYIEGTLEIVNNEDVYTYDVNVSYSAKNNYKVDLVNKVNNHEQIILRNSDGVYVITPKINKSFKFQSDWPYNNSQVYLLGPLLEDITNDEKREFTKVDDGYKLVVAANYPNNSKLVKQEILLDKNANIKKVTVLDKDNNPAITMKFDKIDLKSKFKDSYFDLKEIIDTREDSNNTTNNDNTNTNNNANTNTNNNANTNVNENTNTNENSNDVNNPDKDSTTNNNVNNNTNNNTNSNENNNSTETKETKETSSIEDVIYPMYIPSNTYLSNKEKVSKDGGERLILTFDGDNPFMLIEETVSYEKEHLIVPTYGELELMASTIAIVNDNSVNWIDNNIEYYVVSDKLSKSELLDIARSVSVLPVSK